MTDTHTHLYMDQYAGEEAEVVIRAIEAGVDRLWFANVDASTIAPMKTLHEAFPENTLVSIGLHPTDVEEDWEEELTLLEEEAEKYPYSAIGEIGLDLYHDRSNFDNQRKAFLRQMDLALRSNLPVMIHCREARDELLDALREIKDTHGGRLPKMIFHSFTGKKEDVEAIRRECDPLFGINGVVTFKNAPDLREALPVIGIERIVLETDAPYLAPVPHRGTRNESSYIPIIRDTVASVLGLHPDEVSRITDRNAAEFIKVR